MKISTALIALGYLVLFLGILLGPSAALGDDCHDYSNHMRYVSRTLSGYDHQDIVLHGSYLLSVGPQNGLLVADISDPTDPFPVSSLWLDSYQFGLAAEGDLAAIMAYTSDDGEMEGEGPASGAVQLVDISDPAHPEFEGELTFRTAPDDIAMHNSHVYLAMRNLVIIDASNPAEPATVNRVPFINASEILISDGVAFVMDNLFDDSGVLHILDLTDPAEPLEIASLETAWTVNNMAIDENLLYLGCRQDAATGNLLVIDISDIADPFLVSTTALPMWPQALDVDNGVATIQCHLLTTYDVAQPEGPVKLGQTDSSTGASTILMRDGYAFLATGTHGVQIYDISHPTSADFIGSNPIPPDPEDIVTDGTLAYVVDRFRGLLVFDISDPLKPAEVAQTEIPASATRRKIERAGDYAYIASGGLRIVDVSDPHNPQPRGGAAVAEPPFSYNVKVRGDYAYLGTSEGVLVYLITDPDHPLRMSTLTFDDFSSYLDIEEDYLYVGSSAFSPYRSWLNVLDLSVDPVLPERVGSVEIDFGHGMVEVFGDIAYVGGHDYVVSTMSVIDISVPDAPTLLGSTVCPNSLYDFMVVDGIGYGASPYTGLSVFDLTEPADPQFMCNVPIESGELARTICLLGNNIAVGADGLYYALPHCDSSAGSDGPVSNPAAYNATVRLIGARPNPFNPKTSIDFTLTTPQKIRVAIYNLEGRHVTTLCDKGFSPGPHSIVWNGLDSDGRPVASNLYMIRLEGEREQEVKKVIYLK